MKKLLRFLIVLSFLLPIVGCKKETPEEESLKYPKEPIYAVWFSYLEYQENCLGMDSEAFSEYVDGVIANLTDLGINTLYVHAVAFTDAFYTSDIYPSTRILGEIDYDPLELFIQKGKTAGLHVEAWINPMRSVKTDEVEYLPDDFIVKQWILENNERVRQNEDRYYLNPAYPEVRSLICSVVKEIVNKYDVDGIHMDDYFYPYTTGKNFDAYVYGLAKKENEDLTLEEFRRGNVDQMVQQIHDVVKAKDSNLWFGISPAGNIDNCKTMMFAYPEDWVEQGTVDYLMPQIYWGFLHPIKPFEPTLHEWLNITEDSEVMLIPGLAAYNIGYTFSSLGEEAQDEWEINEELLAQETQMAIENGCYGVAYYRYGSLFTPKEEVKEIVEKEIIHIKNTIISGLSLFPGK